MAFTSRSVNATLHRPIVLFGIGLLVAGYAGPLAAGNLTGAEETDLRFTASSRPVGEELPDGTREPDDLIRLVENIFSEDDFRGEFPNGIVLRSPDGDQRLTTLDQVEQRIQTINNRANARFLSFFLLAVNRDGQLTELSESFAKEALKLIYDPDPYLVYDATITNPLDEPLRLAFTLEGDLVPGLAQTGAFSTHLDAQVFDTGGDPGASIDNLVQVFNITAVDDLGEAENVEIDFLFGDATDTAPFLAGSSDDDTNFVFSANQNPSSMRIGTEFRLSPGDTAQLSGYFAIGDDQFPIFSDAELLGLRDFLQSISTVPEPATGALLLIPLVLTLRRPSRQS